MIKQKLQLKDSKHYLKPNQIIFKSQQKIESETHNVFTEKVDDVTEKKITNDNNPNWNQIPSHPNRIWMIAGYESAKKCFIQCNKQSSR